MNNNSPMSYFTNGAPACWSLLRLQPKERTDHQKQDINDYRKCLNLVLAKERETFDVNDLFDKAARWGCMHESHCPLRQAFALQGGQTGHHLPTVLRWFSHLISENTWRKVIEKGRNGSHMGLKDWDLVVSLSFTLPRYLLSFWNVFSRVLPFRLLFLSLFLQHSFLWMAPLWLTGWSGGDSVSSQQTQQMNCVRETKVLRS